jgi:hypothetical protein
MRRQNQTFGVFLAPLHLAKTEELIWSPADGYLGASIQCSLAKYWQSSAGASKQPSTIGYYHFRHFTRRRGAGDCLPVSVNKIQRCKIRVRCGITNMLLKQLSSPHRDCMVAGYVPIL